MSLDVDGVSWTVQVTGRARGGPSAAPAPLLLLGFSRDGETEVALESMVVARSLSGMTEREIVSALETAAPPPDPDRESSLFPGATDRRGRKG